MFRRQLQLAGTGFWMPVNLRSSIPGRLLLNFYLYYNGNNFKIECPTGSPAKKLK